MHLYRNGKDFLDTSNLLIFLVHFGVPVDGSSGDHHGHAKTLKDTMYLTLVLMGGGEGVIYPYLKKNYFHSQN